MQSHRTFSVIRAVLIGVLLTLPFAADADAQYFGRNKVLWEDFDFKVLKTEHFDIYYYGDKDPAVEDAARMAERWYERLSTAFGAELSERKPIVLYKNHADFQQTTTTGGLIGEGTGGFTDAFRNRVVMPLTENYASTDHVLGHELVHVFQFDTSARLRRGTNSGGRLQNLPLWMVEGLAEYLSQGHYDVQTSMWLRDALIEDQFPDIRKLTTDPRFSPYQYGQAFWAYVAGRWSDRAAMQLFYASQIYGIEAAIKRVLGLDAKTLFADWQSAVREEWTPVLAQRVNPAAEGRVVLERETTDSDLNVSPSLSPDGRLVAFLSTRDLFGIDLYLADATTGRVIDRLVSASQTPHFDALRFIDSAGGWSPDGSRLAVAIIERGDNRLAIVDVNGRKVERRIKIDGIEAVTNPSWFPDGRSIVFSGMTSSGISDLYRIDLESERVTRLTSDRWGDLHPVVSPDGRSIAFITERGDERSLAYLPMQLALLDTTSGAVRVLDVFPGARHINPQFSPDGSTLFFIADPDGVSDVFALDIASGAVRRITNVATGVAGITELSPALSVSQSGAIMVSVFEDDGWRILSLTGAEAAGGVTAAYAPVATPRAGTLPPGTATQGENFVGAYLEAPRTGLPAVTEEYPVSDYKPRLGLDYVGPPSVGVGVNSLGNVGLGGSVAFGFGDVLGRHQVGLYVTTTGQSSQNILDQIGIETYYLNQTSRVQWGVTGSHVPYQSYGRTTVRRGVPIVVDGQNVNADIYETQVLESTFNEANFIAQYPFGLTRRIEGKVGYQGYGYDLEVQREIVVGNTLIDVERESTGDLPSLSLYNGGAAFVGDSSFFGFISPVSGTRYRLEARTFGGDLQFQDALIDYRRYFFMRPVTVAVRGMHFGRYGADAEDTRISPLYIGRANLVRGYEAGDFSAAECSTLPGSQGCPEFDRLIGSKIALANMEVRFPLFGSRDYGVFDAPYFATEIGAFVDAGVAWTEDENPVLEYDTESLERVPVVSVGALARILLGGYLPINLYYAKPLHRPDVDWQFGFSISPGW